MAPVELAELDPRRATILKSLDERQLLSPELKTRTPTQPKKLTNTWMRKRTSRKEEGNDAVKYRDYFEWSELFKSIPSHRMLAIRRGEKEAFLFMRVEVPLERVSHIAVGDWVSGNGQCAEQIRLATEDGCKRLLMPSMETEMHQSHLNLASPPRISPVSPFRKHRA